MRVTGNRMIEIAAAATASNQERVAAASAQVSSGMRVGTPSDDPAAWVAAERAKLHRTMTQGVGAAVRTSRDRLDEVDGALATIGDVVSQVRSLAVQGANASYNANDRTELAVQVRAMMQTALGAANAKSSDGEYLLAGTASLVTPFAQSGAYAGNATTRAVPISDDGTTTVSTVTGADLTAAHGVDVLPLLERLATALAANDSAGVSGMLGDFETAVRQVGLARTRAGGAMSVLDATITATTSLEDNLSKEISRKVEADTVGAATELALATQSFEAARVVSSHVINLLDPRST
jgi:flagellar hook-associated protein 3 FlgL